MDFIGGCWEVNWQEVVHELCKEDFFLSNSIKKPQCTQMSIFRNTGSVSGKVMV